MHEKWLNIFQLFFQFIKPSIVYHCDQCACQLLFQIVFFEFYHIIPHKFDHFVATNDDDHIATYICQNENSKIYGGHQFSLQEMCKNSINVNIIVKKIN